MHFVHDNITMNFSIKEKSLYHTFMNYLFQFTIIFFKYEIF